MERAVFCDRQPTLSLPGLPKFEREPFLAFVARGDVTGLGRVLGENNFMASNEINLLNSLLFAKERQTDNQVRSKSRSSGESEINSRSSYESGKWYSKQGVLPGLEPV